MAIMDNIERLANSYRGTVDSVLTASDADEEYIGPISDYSRDFLEASGRDDVVPDSGGGNVETLAAPTAGAATSPSIIGVGGIAAEAVYPVAASAFNTIQVGLVAGRSVQLVSPNPQRLAVTIANTDPTNFAYIGANAAVSTNSGYPLGPGAAVTWAITSEVWATCATNLIVAAAEFIGI